MSREELGKVLDFILNKANHAELEAIIKAVERRRQDEGRYAALDGLNPAALATKMADYVQSGVEESMEGLRQSLKDYIERIVRQKEPGISAEQLGQMLDACLPDRSKMNNSSVHDSELSSELLAAMVRDFCDYSLGRMPVSKQKELWDYMGDWKNIYWNAFPPSIKAVIKAFLEGRLGEEEFWKAVFSIAGM
ncbi:hypothetical protein MASR2M29_07330 [Spirochaetota bacterium]